MWELGAPSTSKLTAKVRQISIYLPGFLTKKVCASWPGRIPLKAWKAKSEQQSPPSNAMVIYPPRCKSARESKRGEERASVDTSAQGPGAESK